MSAHLHKTVKTLRRALKGVSGKERKRLLNEVADLSWSVSDSQDLRDAVTLLRSELAQSGAA